jgi:hypothetical protein
MCVVHHPDYLLLEILVIDYVQLFASLSINLILEMYSRYFDPIKNIIIAS